MLGISGRFWLPHHPPDDRCMIVRPETPASAGGVEIERGGGQLKYIPRSFISLGMLLWGSDLWVFT
jgi:hypothetical protein